MRDPSNDDMTTQSLYGLHLGKSWEEGAWN